MRAAAVVALVIWVVAIAGALYMLPDDLFSDAAALWRDGALFGALPEMLAWVLAIAFVAVVIARMVLVDGERE